MEKKLIKKNKIIKLLLLILIFIILFFIVQSTYSKYTSTENKVTEFKISGWNIWINGINITKTQNFSEKLELKFDKNTNIKDNALVPTSTGYFTIEIDSTGTDIPFEYNISVDDSTIKDFKITSYKFNDGTEKTVTSEEKSVTGIINPPDNLSSEVKNTLKFYVQWYDKDSAQNGYDELDETVKDKSDNYNDVYDSKSQLDPNIKIPVNVTVTQINKLQDISNTTI